MEEHVLNVIMCLRSTGEVEEIFKICLDHTGTFTVGKLREWFKTQCGLLYVERLRLEVLVDGTSTSLPDSNSLSTSSAEIHVRGPGVVVQMLSMALYRKGTLLEQRRCFMHETEHSGRMQPAHIVEGDVSSETFARNLACVEGPLCVIFLDIDGVLNHGSSMEGIDRSLAQRLAKLVQATNAHIVLSTTWRHSPLGRMNVLTALVDVGLPCDCIIGATPDVSDGDMCMERATEICEWLATMPEDRVAAWVVLDDMDLCCCSQVHGHVVCTDVRVGLTDAQVVLAQKILMGGT